MDCQIIRHVDVVQFVGNQRRCQQTLERGGKENEIVPAETVNGSPKRVSSEDEVLLRAIPGCHGKVAQEVFGSIFPLSLERLTDKLAIGDWPISRQAESLREACPVVRTSREGDPSGTTPGAPGLPLHTVLRRALSEPVDQNRGRGNGAASA
jgi:hypothetical protein